MINCSIYNPLGHGINIVATVTDCVIANCYVEGVTQSGKYAIANTSGTNTDLVRCIGNAYYNCPNGTLYGITESFAPFDSGTLASSAFVAPASQNFTINSVGQSIAFPGKFEDVTAYQGYLDIGAVQHQASGGGGIPRIGPDLIGGICG